MLQVAWEIDDRGWVRLALRDGTIIPPMMSLWSSLTRFWRALQPLSPSSPFKGSGEYSCEDSRHPLHSSSSSILRAMDRQWFLYGLASFIFYLQPSVQSWIEGSISKG
jgi:hypothetical protein